MQGIERAYCDVCINALVGAWRELLEASAAEALRTVPYGKADTLGLDAITEITIDRRIKEFDAHAILITEELDEQASRRWPTDSDPVKQPLMFFCDPTDRSAQLKLFIKQLSKNDPAAKVGDLMAGCEARTLWEEMFEPPAEVTGSTAAITCVRKGEIVFSVLLNFITNTVFTATDTGVFRRQLCEFSNPLNEDLTLMDVVDQGKPVRFHGVKAQKYSDDDCKQFVTFAAKEGYNQNVIDSKLFVTDFAPFLRHEQPPGPPRALFLSELQQKHGPVGFILGNGEKIGEWMHWLSFVKYVKNKDGGNALLAFEVTLERPWTKNGMLMSTAPAYSIFCQYGGHAYLDVSRLRNFERPSQFRCMLVLVPYDNQRIIHVLEQHQYRNVTAYF